jgi:ABC-type nitrate/sulfonate/bicarbonate transport system permease component
MARGEGSGVKARGWRALSRWLVLAAGVAAWEAWARWKQSPFFPPPTTILAQMYHTWFSGPATHLFLTGNAVGNILPSLGRILAGMAISAAIGVPAGVAIGRSATISAYLEPIFHFARAIPPVTLAPVFIALFKLGTEMELATIVFGTVWPILLNTADGAKSVDPQQIETARAFRLTPAQRFVWLIIPASLPKIFAGLRLSMALALILMVFSELVGSNNGLGYELNNASSSFELPAMWSAIVLLGVLGYVLNGLLLAVERRMLAWHRGARKPAN